MLVDTSKCADGCTACVEACDEENGLESAGHAPRRRPAAKWQNQRATWIRKVKLQDNASGHVTNLPLMCQHCEHPPCVDVCPTGASFKRADGIVMVDRHTCIGCRYCMMACPYKARSFIHEQVEQKLTRAPRGKGCVESCNLCAHRLDEGETTTACAEACARRAIRPSSSATSRTPPARCAGPWPSQPTGRSARTWAEHRRALRRLDQRPYNDCSTCNPWRGSSASQRAGPTHREQPMAKRIVYREWRLRPERYWGLLAVLAGVIAIGGAAALYMEHQGHWVTGMTNSVVWGTPHVFAVFLIVAASGALNVASIGTVFGKPPTSPWKAVRPAGRRAAGGGLLVLVLDLGRPDRLLVAMTTYNFSSIFAWNIFLYTGFLAITIALPLDHGRAQGQQVPEAGRHLRLPLAACADHRYRLHLRLPGGPLRPTTPPCWRRCSSSCPSPTVWPPTCWC
jgi:Fe-S-cluster-containing dehydrogenase component